MIIIGACNYGQNRTNHDIGGYCVNLALKKYFKNNKWELKNDLYYKYIQIEDNIFAIHQQGVNNLYQTIQKLKNKFPNNIIIIVMDDVLIPERNFKFSGFLLNGHNLNKNIKLYIKNTQDIHLIRIGIIENPKAKYNLPDHILNNISESNKIFIDKISNNFVFNAITSKNNLSLFIQKIKENLKASVVQ